MKQNKLGKYLLYAAGEIILVVIGILIALQINNANLRKIEKEALSGYLQSISRNIESDVKKAKIINTKRLDLLSRSAYAENNISPRIRRALSYGNNLKSDAYEKTDVTFIAQTLKTTWELNYLNANTSGFESLKSSGYLSKLQGKDIEYLLSEYYGTIAEIASKEANYNERIQNARIEFGKQDFPGSFSLFQSDYVNWDKYNEEFRPLLGEILSHPSFFDSIESPYDITVDYNNLIVIGEELIRLINLKSLDYDGLSEAALNNIFNRFGDEGHATIISDGYLSNYYSNLDDYSEPVEGSMNSVFLKEFRIEFPAIEWGVSYIYVGKGSVEQLATKDYSSFKTIRLELKGEKGGELIKIALKDETNPTDGSEAKVSLTLTSEWKWFEIPLSAFEGTNLKKLFMPLAFVFEKDATTIGVRNVEYVK